MAGPCAAALEQVHVPARRAGADRVARVGSSVGMMQGMAGDGRGARAREMSLPCGRDAWTGGFYGWPSSGPLDDARLQQDLQARAAHEGEGLQTRGLVAGSGHWRLIGAGA